MSPLLVYIQYAYVLIMWKTLLLLLLIELHNEYAWYLMSRMIIIYTVLFYIIRHFFSFFFGKGRMHTKNDKRLRPIVKSDVNESEEGQKCIKYFRGYSCRTVASIFVTERTLL